MIMQITNTKIEKQRAEIDKTKAKISEFTAKLREQEKELRKLEDLEIVAQFRKERMSDENLGALRTNKAPSPPADSDVSSNPIKEDTRNANTEKQ
jgi:septal ring factor EnvC (AmiA/AmiB activator)